MRKLIKTRTINEDKLTCFILLRETTNKILINKDYLGTLYLIFNTFTSNKRKSEMIIHCRLGYTQNTV